jgi:hypothetical protein
MKLPLLLQTLKVVCGVRSCRGPFRQKVPAREQAKAGSLAVVDY